MTTIGSDPRSSRFFSGNLETKDPLVHLSIKCRCSCTIIYQCTTPNPQSLSYSAGLMRPDLAVNTEIPVFCYSCGSRVTTLYRDGINGLDTVSIGTIKREPMHSTSLDLHPQQQMNTFLAAQYNSKVPTPSQNFGASTSLLPKLDSPGHQVEFEDDVSESPSARTGTILPIFQ